ncbi:MAG: stage V sporulation protein AB [Clostridiales bacterium]|jgi:stage V sporulation protein AB|nr:stage V sporulation protein AB [Clostridiales bacterium]
MREALSCFVGFSSGAVISGAVFAFIAVIGVVPRLAQKTRTTRHIRRYEDCVAAGGILGTLLLLKDNVRVPAGGFGAVLYSLAAGVFYGCLAMSIAEVLNVIPILKRRLNIKTGMFFFVAGIALGKLAGSVIYYAAPGFYKNM